MRFVLDDKIVLGEGRFTKIFHGTLDSEPIAAKKSTKDTLLQEEARFLRLCDHPNVVRYRGLMEIRNESYLIMEFARGGNLKEHLGQHKFSPAQKRSFVRQISLGLDHVHSKNILHGNIEPTNILFKDCQNLVISDFAKAKEFIKGVPRRTINECVPDTEYTFKSDVYLLALVAYQIFEDMKHVNRKTLGNKIEREACETGGLNREIFEKQIWEYTIMNSLFWKAERRPTAMEFHNAFDG